MKQSFLVSILLLELACRSDAEVIAQWTFNSTTPDDTPATGMVLPTAGYGTAETVGGVQSAFTAGDTASDPAKSVDNSGWNTSGYPAAATNNKTAGVRFTVDTTGWKNVKVSWSQRNSSTASRFSRFRYTVDGSEFLDHAVISGGDAVFSSISIDCSALPGVEENPLFGFEIVSEFQSTALGTGVPEYVATREGSKYGSTGTIRFDMVTVSGSRIGAPNTPPTLSLPNRTNTVAGESVWIPVEAVDAESPVAGLIFSGGSSAPDILDANGFEWAVSSLTWLHLKPSPTKGGVVLVNVAASDGEYSAEAFMPLIVTPDRETLLVEPFNYPDMSLTNSRYWLTRSGIAGQAQVRSGQLELSAKQTEDVIAPLLPHPLFATNNAVLYAGFSLRTHSLPRSSPGLLAHFGDGNTLRGRLFVCTTNAPPGTFRLAVANGSNSAVEHPLDCATNAAYRVVIRYSLESPATSLWVNPANEADACTDALDSQAPLRISYFGFREDADLGGDLSVDDLRIGTTFAAALGPPTEPAQARLTCTCGDGTLVLTWEGQANILEQGDSPQGPFVAVPGAVSPHQVQTTARAAYFRLCQR